MMFPFVSDLAAEGIPVRTTCGVLGFSTQAFYKWRARPCSDRDWADAHTTNVIVDVHADDPEFGYRFIADELEAAGQRSCERRIWRLCREQRIWSTTTKKGRRSSGKTPGPAVHDDLVRRVFSAPAPDVLWLTDITEHPTMEGKLYCCSIKDVFSNRIVGYAFGPRMTAQLAVRALRSAIARRRPESTVVVHSDRGGQFRSRAFRAALKANGLVGSMGRVAAAADNAAMESFYALLQKNVLNRRRRWHTRDELASEIITWIEHTYNRRRRQRGLGKLSPVAYELTFVSPPCLEDNELAA
jgi:transposase InsO family protein